MTPDGLLLAALGSALFPSAVHAAVQCYSINGTRADDSHAPCDPDAEVSACCALNKSRPDICLSSGLCYAQDVNYHGLIYSNGCTDPTGQADECPHLCPDRTNDWDGGSEVSVWNVLQCDKGDSFCCRAATDSENCCDSATRLDIGTLVIPTSTATVHISGSVTATADVEQVTATETRYVASDCPKDNTAVVGGAVGGAMGAALLASLGVIAVMWRRKPQGPAPTEYTYPGDGPAAAEYQYSGDAAAVGGYIYTGNPAAVASPASKGYTSTYDDNTMTNPTPELEARGRSELVGV